MMADRAGSKPIYLLTLVVLPIAFVVSAVTMRQVGGPFWLTHTLDPSYYYLFDGLNILSLNPPGHIYHPGTPVQLLAGFILKIAHIAASADEIVSHVLDDPEAHLHLLSSWFVAMQAALLALVGWLVLRITNRLSLALLIQTAPFLSMLVLKNSYHVKPEPVLVMVTLAMICVTLLAVREGELERRWSWYAIWFGILAGLGTATKLTAAPIFVFPLFILGRPRSIVLYGIIAAAALVLLTLPAAPVYGEMVRYFGSLLLSSGDFTAGAATVIDPTQYPKAVLKLLERPVVHLPIVIGIFGGFVLAAMSRKSPDSASPWPRVLIGIGVAVAIHVIVIGKQPAAFYLVPSLIMAPLAVVALALALGMAGSWSARAARLGNGTLMVLLVGLVAGQAVAVMEEVEEIAAKRRTALSVSPERFGQCAQVSFYAASSLDYAMLLSNHLSRRSFSNHVAGKIGDRAYWVNDYFDFEPNRIENAAGEVKLSSVVAESQCVVFRGKIGRASIANFVRPELAEPAFDHTCRIGVEVIYTRGIDCDGNLLER